IYEWFIFERQFVADHKIIAMNFPVNTTEQQEHIQHVMKRTTNPNSYYFLEQELDRLEELEKNRVNKEYYL
ncbi:hypothetical protein V7101_20725, partial [Bacillus velezensis]